MWSTSRKLDLGMAGTEDGRTDQGRRSPEIVDDGHNSFAWDEQSGLYYHPRRGARTGIVALSLSNLGFSLFNFTAPIIPLSSRKNILSLVSFILNCTRLASLSLSMLFGLLYFLLDEFLPDQFSSR